MIVITTIIIMYYLVVFYGATVYFCLKRKTTSQRPRGRDCRAIQGEPGGGGHPMRSDAGGRAGDAAGHRIILQFREDQLGFSPKKW